MGARSWPTPSLFWFALAVALVSTAENWALGPLSWIYAYGSGLETIPTFLALTHDGWNHSMWAPFAVGGVDRIAFWGNASPFGLEYFFFAYLPTWLANGLYRFLQYFIGVYFTSRVLVDVFHQPWSWAALGGLAFACFGYFTVGQLLTLPGTPLFIWTLERLFRSDARIVPFMICGAALSFLTTFTFGVPYLIAFSFLWLLSGCSFRATRDFTRLAAFYACFTVPTLAQLWAVAINAPTSHRAGWPVEELKFSFDGLIYTQLQYDLFNQDKLLSWITQTLPLAVFVAATLWISASKWRGAKLQSLEWDCLRVSLLYLLIAQKWLWVSLQTLASFVIPWAGGVYMGRFFEIPATFLIAVGLALVGRLVWTRLADTPRAGFGIAAAALALFMLLEPKRFTFAPLGLGDWGEANYQVAALKPLAAASRTDPFRVASVLPLQPAYAYAQGIEAADGWANIYSAHYRDLWLRVLGPLFTELPATRSFFGVDSGRAVDNFVFLGAGLMSPTLGKLPDEDIDRALKSGFDIDRRFRSNILKLLNVRYLLSEYPLRGHALRLVHAPSEWPAWPIDRDPNTGYVNSPLPPLSAERRTAASPMRALYRFNDANQRKRQGKDIFIYEIEGALPRAWLASDVRVLQDDNSILDAIEALDDQGLGQTAFVNASDLPAPLHATDFGPGVVTIDDYQADRISLRFTSTTPAFLVIANTWSASWKVSIDAKPTALLRTNNAQMGLPVPPGEHTILLQYRPPYAWSGFRFGG